MLALSIVEQDVKIFMSKLLIEKTFDEFLCRDVKITSFTDFAISGVKIKQEFSQEENETDDSNSDESSSSLENKIPEKPEYHTWSTIKPYIFHIIKGSSKPKSMRIVFSPNKDLMEEISNDASSMFLNLHFEKNSVQITTATSQRTFDLNNSVDKLWEEYATKFLQSSEIPFIENNL